MTLNLKSSGVLKLGAELVELLALAREAKEAVATPAADAVRKLLRVVWDSFDLTAYSPFRSVDWVGVIDDWIRVD